MKPYQEEYLALLGSVAQLTTPLPDKLTPDAFVEIMQKFSRSSMDAIERGTRLLRENLFPVLGDILAASEEEIASLTEFAGKLMSGAAQKDVALHYRIHMALLSRARLMKDRDGIIRELYFVGMSLYNMDAMLSPASIRLYTMQMRRYFSECASYFETQYGDIKDPETRGYIHRSMGNIALSYSDSDPLSAKTKLSLITRAIRILSDPDIRAMTPSLPWDLYVYKSHQERTTLLSFLRSGQADADTFAQVLESAQIVQERQMKASRERGEELQPRWQYAYMAARYHCGAMLLPELLDGLYALSTARSDDDMGDQSLFSHLSAPALFIRYSKDLKDTRYQEETAERVNKITRHLLSWIVKVPSNDRNELMMFYLRQFLYAYKEFPDGISFFDLVQDIFAARQPATYARMWIAGQIAGLLTRWMIDDCPEVLVGLPGYDSVEDVTGSRDRLCEFVCRGGRLYDVGMIHFLNMEASACRGLFEEEEALIQLHVRCGKELLAYHSSTAVFADVAGGHHRDFNEKGGFPTDFPLNNSPVRPIILIVAVSDLFSSSVEETSSRYRPIISFDEACGLLEKGCGTKYAPFVVNLLRSDERRRELKEHLEIWKKEAYLDMYRRREKMLQP